MLYHFLFILWHIFFTDGHREARDTCSYTEGKVGWLKGEAATSSSESTSRIPVNLNAVNRAKSTWFHGPRRQCIILPPPVDLYKQDQPVLGRSVSATGDGSPVFNPTNSALASGHSESSRAFVRLPEKKKNYAPDSRALNGYPCLHWRLHTSQPCEKDLRGVGGWGRREWKRASVCLTVPALNQVNGFYSLHR